MSDKGFDVPVFDNDWTGMGLTGGPVKGSSRRDADGSRVDQVKARWRPDGSGLSIGDVDYHSHAVGDGGVGGPKDSVEARRLDRAGGEMAIRRREIRALADFRHNLSLDELMMVLRYLPKGFLGVYMNLIDRGVGERNLGSGAGAGDGSKVEDSGKAVSGLGQVVSGVQQKRGGAKKGKGGSNGRSIPLRDQGAIDCRSRVDRKLRAISREVNTFLGGDDPSVSSVRVCQGKCKKIGEPDWLFCPRCGGPMAERD